MYLVVEKQSSEHLPDGSQVLRNAHGDSVHY